MPRGGPGRAAGPGQKLGGAAVIDFGIQLVGWAFAAALKTEKFYDLCGSLAFASTAAMTYASSARLPRQGLITGLVCTWTARLGMFLVRRVFRDEARDFGRFAVKEVRLSKSREFDVALGGYFKCVQSVSLK